MVYPDFLFASLRTESVTGEAHVPFFPPVATGRIKLKKMTTMPRFLSLPVLARTESKDLSKGMTGLWAVFKHFCR